MNTLKMNVFDKYESVLREALGDEEFAQYRRIMEKGIANEAEGCIPERGQARVELAEALGCTPGKVTVRVLQLRKLMLFHTDPDLAELSFNQAPIWRLVRIVLAKQEESLQAEQEVAEQLAERVMKARETKPVTKQKKTSQTELEEIPVSDSEEGSGKSSSEDDLPHGDSHQGDSAENISQVELSDRTLFERDFARPREEKVAEYYVQQLGVASQESMLKLFSKKEIANLLEIAVNHAVMANEEWLHALLGTDSLRNDLHESDVKRNRAEEEREILFRKNLQLQRQLVENQELLFVLEEELEKQQRVQAAFCKLVEMM